VDVVACFMPDRCAFKVSMHRLRPVPCGGRRLFLVLQGIGRTLQKLGAVYGQVKLSSRRCGVACA
jgi:hypothetical protein